MRKPFRKLWLLICALVAVFALPSLQAQPPGAVLKVGTDCWQTETGTEQRLHTIPAGFFGTGSQAVPNPTIKFKGVPLPTSRVKGAYKSTDKPPNCGCPEKVDTKITWLDPHGNPTNDMRHAVKQVVDETTKVDTCVRRTTSARLRGKAPQKVSILLVALSLQSVEPLRVTFKHPGTLPDTFKDFDVFVTESGTQRAGSLTFTPESVAGGKAKGNTKLGSLHITYDVKFVEHGGAATFTMTNQRLQLVNTKGTFEQL